MIRALVCSFNILLSDSKMLIGWVGMAAGLDGGGECLLGRGWRRGERNCPQALHGKSALTDMRCPSGAILAVLTATSILIVILSCLCHGPTQVMMLKSCSRER